MNHPFFTSALNDFFEAEIANEEYGGDSPSTLRSALDSLQQGGAETFGLNTDDLLNFLVVAAMFSWDTELMELVR